MEWPKRARTVSWESGVLTLDGEKQFEVPELTAEIMEQLAAYTLVGFHVKGYPVNDKLLAPFAGHKSMVNFGVEDSALTDACFAFFSAMPKLRYLLLDGNAAIHGSGLSALQGCKLDLITLNRTGPLAKKNGCTVSDQEYDDYAKLLKTQMNKAENRKEIRDFYAGFGGESAYWKNMEPVIRQNLAVRKYIDSQTGTQTEEEIKQEAYESGAKQTDLDAFEQVVEDVCEEIGDYLKTLQKSDASVYYFASSDKERVTKSIDKEEICAIGNHTIVTREQVQMYTKFYEITYDKTLSEKKAIAYAKERNALYVAAMQNGYQVTDEQVKAYVEELKQNLDGIWTKEQKEKLLSGFASEDDYWAFEQKVYRIDLPIQNYVRDKENEFNRKNESGQTWDDFCNGISQFL